MHRECFSIADDNDSLQDGFMPYEGERPTVPTGTDQET